MSRTGRRCARCPKGEECVFRGCVSVHEEYNVCQEWICYCFTDFTKFLSISPIYLLKYYPRDNCTKTTIQGGLFVIYKVKCASTNYSYCGSEEQ